MGVGAIAFSHSGGSYLPQDDITATLSAQTGSQQQTYLAIHADALNRSGEAVNPSIDAAGVSRLRPPGIGMTDDGSTFSLTSGQPHAVAIQAGAVRENPSSGPGGIGMQADLAYTIEARSEVQMVAPTISARTKGGGGLGTDAEVGGALIAHSLRADGFDASEDGSGRGTPMVAQPLQANEGKTYTNEGNMFQLRNVVTGVRRLMPVECERLMGFEDDYTLIPYRGRMAADGPRYKALGNSWAVNVARWVGQRIQMVEDMS
jgi:DNA (cytosine-5)-methyltransferase 1